MKIHEVEQGTDEWLALRRKYFTASNLGDWILSPLSTKTQRSAWSNAIYTKLGDLSLDDEPVKETWAMRRGKELEPMAREAYERMKDRHVFQVGFVSHESEDFGCSPDGLLEDREGEWSNGLELKCHVAKTHSRFLLEGGFREEHALQVHASMATTGIREWHLYGYHPELPPLFEVFQWDSTTDLMLERLLKLGEDFMAAKCRLAEMWKQSQTTHPEPESV